MRNILSFIVLMLPSLAVSQEFRFQPEPDFELGVVKAISAVRPQDAFLAASECQVVDARFVRPVPIEQAARMLGECLSAVATKYGGADLIARRGTVTREEAFTAQVEVLMILVPKSISNASPLVRDLRHGLSARSGRLLGHKTVIERVEDRTVTALSAPAQEAIDACILPTIVRKIESGADFIKHYGGCLLQQRSLRVVDIRPSPAQRLGVILLSEAERPVVASLTGPVKVVAANGPVEVQLLAYSNPVYLP